MDVIAMVNYDWGIGKDGNQLVTLKNDLALFKALTTGRTIIAGRKTLETFPNKKPLPFRRNVILSGNKSLKIPGAEVAHCIEEVLAMAPDGIVVGGESVYRAFLPYCSTAYITKVWVPNPADRFFPDLDNNVEWFLEEAEKMQYEGNIPYHYCKYHHRSRFVKLAQI